MGMLGRSKPLLAQSPAKASKMAAPRAADPNFGAGFAVVLHELRQRLCMAALVEHVAAKDDVESPEPGHRLSPPHLHEIDRGNAVERGVVIEKCLDERMMVAGGDVRFATFQDEAW